MNLNSNSSKRKANKVAIFLKISLLLLFLYICIYLNGAVIYHLLLLRKCTNRNGRFSLNMNVS